MHRLRPAAVLVALLLLLAASPARAMGRVIPTADGPVQVDELRVAVALSPGQTTLWTAFRLSGSASHVAVVLPVAPGSFVDPGSEAWLRALESATAPRVIAPANAPVCVGGSSNQVENTAQNAAGAVLHPLKIAVLDTLADLDDFAKNNQLALSAADRAALDLPGQRLLALLYAMPQGTSAFTQTLRVTEPVELSSLPMGIAWDSGAAPIPYTLWLVAAGRARISGTELAPANVKATWHEFDGNSDYVQRRHDLLSLQPGESFIRESSGNARLFGWTILSGQGGSVPPAADAYYAAAAKIGDTTSDPADCSHSAAQARVAGTIGMTVARACAPGLLARVPLDGGADPTCTEQVPTGYVDPDTLRCGAADDFAMALSGLRADQAGLTRLEGMLGSHSDASSPVQQVPSDPRTPGVIASKLDSDGCQPQPTGGSGGYGNYGGYSGSTASGGYGGYGGYAGYAGGYSSNSGGNVYVDTSCSSSSSDSSCSGDSSSNSSSCSGDSSGSNGSTCSGNSSSSSDGSTCGGDSSSSSSGSTCSGSSSSGDGATCSSGSGDGATCSGSSGSSGSGCSLVPGHHAPLSVWSLVLASVFLPFRRFSRRAARGRRRRRGHRVVHAGRRLW